MKVVFNGGDSKYNGWMMDVVVVVIVFDCGGDKCGRDMCGVVGDGYGGGGSLESGGCCR